MPRKQISFPVTENPAPSSLSAGIRSSQYSKWRKSNQQIQNASEFRDRKEILIHKGSYLPTAISILVFIRDCSIYWNGLRKVLSNFDLILPFQRDREERESEYGELKSHLDLGGKTKGVYYTHTPQERIV